MSLKLGMQHRELKLYNVCIYDDPGLTLTYFTVRSNLVASAFEWGKLTNSIYGKILAANDRIGRRFMFSKTFDPRRLSAPALGLYTCICPLFSNIFSETAWPIKAKLYMKRGQEFVKTFMIT